MRKFTLITVCIFSILSYAIEPAINLQSYYSGIQNKSNDNIVTTLQSIISANYNSISYSGLEPYYEQTDFKDGKILDMYSTCSFTMSDANCSQKNVCDCWNKEHSIPQSWFNEASPMKSDLFHVYPTDARVNNFRSNYPYGETNVTSNIDNSPSALGHLGASNRSGYTGTVYEPDAQYKGDFARTYLYMVTRYADKNFTQSAQGKVMFNYANGRAELTDYSIALLLKWHREDPVSEKEVERNNAVYGIQKNRNPYIDYPYLVEYVWGKEKGKQIDFSKIISAYDPTFVLGVSDGSRAITDPTLIVPKTSIEFLPILAGTSSTETISLQGLNLTGAISLAISGDGFAVSPASISAANANGINNITITFRPTTDKIYTGNLSISSVNAETVTISLRGVCASEHTIQWLVNGEQYTAGNPSVKVVEGARPSTIPTAPTTCDEESSQFVGWTATPITGSTNVVPDDLFSDESEAPLISKNTIFYAVFAKMDGTSSTTESIVMSDREDITQDVEVEGRKIAIDEDKHITFVCDKGSNQNGAKYYSSNPASIRVYGGASVTISADAPMTKIEFDISGNTMSANTGTWTSPVWTGDAKTVVFSISGTSGHTKLKSISVTYGGGVAYSRFITSWTCGEDEPTAIEEVTKDELIGPVMIYTMMGQYVGTVDANDLQQISVGLPTGIYLLHGSKHVCKIIMQ